MWDDPGPGGADPQRRGRTLSFLDSLPQGVAQEQAGRRQERRLEQLSLF